MRAQAPREKQEAAAASIGYGQIRLRYEDQRAIVSIYFNDREVDVIREFIGPIDGAIDHSVYPIGIEEEILRSR